MKNSLLATASLVALTVINPANAQEMDYGQLSQVFGEAVTTSATGSPQRATEVPADMDIITADDIRHSGAHSIPDVLANVVGLDTRQYAAEATEVNVRGGIQPATPRLLVLVNGRQVYLDYYGYVPWSAIPVQMSEIRQIEVVKGPASALFGFNAVSGVVNIVTYSPLKDETIAVQGSTGTQGYANGSMVYTQHIGKDFGIKLSAGITREHDFANHGNIKMNSYAADARYQVLSNVELSLEGTHAETSTFELSPIGVFGSPKYATTSIRGGVLADTFLGLVNVEAYSNAAAVTKYFKIGSTTTTMVYNNKVMTAKGSDLFKIGTDHSVRVSFEYRNVSTTPGSLATDAIIGYRVFAGSLMWNWQITPKLSMMNSIRLDDLKTSWEGTYVTIPASIHNAPTKADFNNNVMDTFSYNSGLVWKLSDLDTVRVLAGRGVQVPSLLALDDFGNATSGTPQATYGLYLKPSYLDNYEIGYDRKVDEILSTVRVNFYHQIMTNLLQYTTHNLGSSIQSGLELSIKGQSQSGLRWNASYAWRTISDKIGTNTGSTMFGVFLNFEDGTPKSKASFGLGYTYDKFDVDVQGRWQSGFLDLSNINTSSYSPVPTYIQNYFALNARIAYRLSDDFTLSLSGTQLGNSKQVQSGGLPVERRLFVTATESL